jgi:cytochrome c oxidase subunit IV
MIFKILSILFILNNLYYIVNYKRLDEPFRMRDTNKKLDLVHYLLKVLYFIWIGVGIFKYFSIFLLVLISLSLLRLPIHLINKKFSLIYHRLVPPFIILTLIGYLIS